MQNKLFKNPLKSGFKKRFILCFLVLGIIQSATASPEQERIYLLQLIHQIDSMKPTVLAAQREQSKTARIQFHYTAYRDVHGQWHPGVWEDLQSIRSGIEEKLEHSPAEGRTPEPVQGDYMDSIQQEKSHE
jgi:RAQPRD family integrative conjugative element protein